MLKNPWWKHVEGPFPTWEGPLGCKPDGGGSHRGQGKVGAMEVHRAVYRKDADAVRKAVENGASVNEVEGAGCTPLHNAAWCGWLEGVELLLELGAKIDASNNAGDRPYHWALLMDHKDVMDFLVAKGATTERGQVIVQDHTPKVWDFFKKDCWAHHPKPYQDFMDWRRKKDQEEQEDDNRTIPDI